MRLQLNKLQKKHKVDVHTNHSPAPLPLLTELNDVQSMLRSQMLHIQ